MNKRTHIVIPEQLAHEIDTLVGKRARSGFLTEAARKELRRRQMVSALEQATGSWKDEDHPELKAGSAKYVARLRKEGDKRLPKTKQR